MSSIKVGNIVEGQITGITKYGVFLSLEDKYTGMVHISEVSDKFVNDLEHKFIIGDIVKVKILEINEDKLQVKLSIKKIGNLNKKKKSIQELGDGFKPLKEKLPIWTVEKLKELSKKVE